MRNLLCAFIIAFTSHLAFAQLPDGASLERTQKIIDRAGEIARTIPGVKGTVQFPGYNLLVGGNLPNAGTMFVSLESFDDRKDPRKSAKAIMGQLYARYAELRDARILVLPPPPVRGLGSTAGFKMMIQDRADVGLNTLGSTAFQMMINGSQTPGLAQVFTTFTTRVPQIFVDVDRVKAKSMNVALADVRGAVLVVSQFTLYGDAQKGRRPSFVDAAPPEVAIPLYERFVALLRERGAGSGTNVETGEFGAMMEVELVNDGPVTLILER